MHPQKSVFISHANKNFAIADELKALLEKLGINCWIAPQDISPSSSYGQVPTPFPLRRDNGLVFTSRSYTRLLKSYGVQQEFITPHCPEQNVLVERVIRTINEQCVHRQRFETLQHASRVIGNWMILYNNKRPHQALKMKTPCQVFEELKLAA